MRSGCLSPTSLSRGVGLAAENLLLRYQLNLALRQAPCRPRLRGSDRALLVWMVRLWPSLLDVVRGGGKRWRSAELFGGDGCL
jgi:hypothetical protein